MAIPRGTPAFRIVEKGLTAIQYFLQPAIPESSTICLNGFWFRPRYVNEWLMALGRWEPYVANLVRSRPRTETFVDVGAHIGYHAQAAADSGRRVIAVEPDPRNLVFLRRNLARRNAAILPVACGESESWQSFDIAKNPLYSRLGIQKGLRVPVLPLDLILAKVEGPTLLKIDVEGHGSQVIHGGMSFIRREKPDIIMEGAVDLPEYVRSELVPGYYFYTPE